MVLTTELRLKDKEGCAYLDGLLDEESKIFMAAFRELKNPQFQSKWENSSKLNRYLCREYGILSRHANSIIYQVNGLLKSYRENKVWEIGEKERKLDFLEKSLERKLGELRKLKEKAALNELNRRGLKKLRNLKKSVYHLRNRINKLRQNIKSLKKDLKNRKYRIGIGGKKLFKSQFHLEQTGFKDHGAWKRAYREKKCHMVYYVGRAAETSGNQCASLFINPENGTLSLRLRKEHVKNPKEKYLWFENLNLPYLKNEVYSILKNPKTKPITIRLLKRERKWYLQILFDWSEPPIITGTKDGIFAIDVNNAFLQQGELDGKGNLLGLNKRVLKSHGSGNKALNEMREQVKEIVTEAGFKGKSIAIEDLDFNLKKAQVRRRGSKRERGFNKMLSSLDYRRFRNEITRCARKCGVEVIAVAAYNTSKIAKEKYCPGRCLTVHQGSTITIGRRAMGFRD